MFNIAIRVHGGINVGLGHLIRCLSLAHVFKELGNRVYFICSKRHEILIQNGFEVIVIDREDNQLLNHETLIPELKLLLEILECIEIHCLIVDHYYASEKYLKELKNHVKILVLIDDVGNISAPVDFLINYQVWAEKKFYPSFYENTKFLLGSQYLLLREEFLNLPKRIIKKNPSQIMITTGGSDNHQLTLRLLKMFTANDETKELHFNVIIGHLFRDKESIEKISKDFKNIKLFYNVSNMVEIMLENDLALSSSGTTIYELAITGTPSISFIIAKDQEKIAKKMHELGCTINLGWHNKINNDKMLKQTLYLLNNYPLRKKMSVLSQNLFDGKGPYRSVKLILNSLRKTS